GRGRTSPDRAHRRPRRLDRRRPRPGGVMELRVLGLYPDQMNIYADRGNIIFLRRRCEWRGIDLFYIGGGQDRDQRAVASDMVETKRAALSEAVDDGAVLLAVCGGYQLLGE